MEGNAADARTPRPVRARRGMPAEISCVREAALRLEDAQATGPQGAEGSGACGFARGPAIFMRMAEEVVEEGLMARTALPAAMSLAGQIARLESRFEEYYRLGEEDAEAKKAQSTLQALDMMGKCEKQLADLKARFFEMTGLDRQYSAKARLAELQCRAAEKGGEVVLKLEGFGEVPMQEE